MSRVRDALAGRRFFITGATGFLGTALVERVLRCIPDSEVVLLIRPGRRSTAAQRATKEILRNDCFDRLRAELGDRFDDEIATRVSAVAGDVATEGLGLDDDGLQLLSECDLVVHSAAAVSFDSPLDAAVEVNLLGPSRVAAAAVLARDAGRPRRSAGTAALPPGLDCVCGRYPPGRGQGGAARRQPVQRRGRLAHRGRSSPSSARRQRGRVTSPRTSDRVPQGCP